MQQDLTRATAPPDFRCPTCGARQALDDICRRCRCDLSLVVAIHRRRTLLRRQCLLCIRRQQPEAALLAAEQLHALAPDADSARLLGIAHLLDGDFTHALQTLIETAAQAG
jgi:hypothetical protein